jgi:glycosyltransferase involved in cell wall biosynthesis
MDKYRVGIVIPALNEAATIRGVVKSAGAYGIPIVVDDGSTDQTAELARQAGAHVVVHAQNCGYDAALESGFREAAGMDCRMVITLDADGQHDPELIRKFIAPIDAGADVVAGIRNARQRLAEHVFAWYTNWWYGIRDPLCGMKAYSLDVYRSLGHFDAYGSIGTELILYAAKKGMRVEQVAFEVRARMGQSRFGRVLSGNYRIFRALLLSFSRIK